MKYAYAAVALAAGAYAQSLSDLPACALPAIEAARKSGTTCGETDYVCICSNAEKLTGLAVEGVTAACGAEVAISQVLPAVQAFCLAVAAGGGASSPAPSSSPSASVPAPTGYPTLTSSSKAPSVTPYPTGGNATSSSKPAPTSSIVTNAAAVAGSIGSLGMLVLGALAAF